jgi:hypothetical protein
MRQVMRAISIVIVGMTMGIAGLWGEAIVTKSEWKFSVMNG